MRIGKWYSYTVVILGLSGCVTEGVHTDVGEQAGVVLKSNALSSNALSSNALSSNALSSNALSSNALSSNALSSNALSSNALSSNALSSNALSSNALVLNTRASMGLEATPKGRELLTYVVRCALASDEVLLVEVAGVVYEFTGQLDLLPNWKHQPLSRHGENVLSGCLLAHVNQFGVSVPISVRNDRLLHTDEEESSRFLSYEGTFYGNLFADPGQLYACAGDPAPSFEVRYPDHDLTAGDRLLRRCTDARNDGSGDTECGFTYVGSCSDVCDTANADGHRACFTNTARTGERYDGTMSVWLLAYDDSASVWPELYHEVYGD